MNLTIDCHNDATLVADPGDTIVITMSADCTASPATAMWNGNGSYDPPTATTSGYLTEPSSFGDSPNHGIEFGWGPYGQRDWYAYSNGGGTTQITTTLAATDGGGTPLTVGVTIAAQGSAAPGYLITWGGPRTGSGAGNLTPWLKAYARGGQDVACDDGWAPSWAQWPNDGQGGWVCEKSERAYLS